MKKITGKIRKCFTTRPLLSCAISLLIVAAIVVVLILCFTAGQKSHVTGTGLVLEPDCWKENENGFRYYDKEGYVSTFGIDVSEWVEDIDFRALKRSGVDFVIFRVGYRGYETGKFVLDNNLAKYLKSASAAGLKMGAYFVSQAIDEAEAVEEAQYVMDHVKGYNMEMPLYIDLEEVYDAARTDVLDAKSRTKIVQAFCDAVEENNYRGGVYANEVWFTDMMEFDKICQYDIWLARYKDTLITDLPINMWQYTDQGVVEGTPMWVDLNTRVSEVAEEETQETQELQSQETQPQAAGQAQTTAQTETQTTAATAAPAEAEAATEDPSQSEPQPPADQPAANQSTVKDPTGK